MLRLLLCLLIFALSACSPAGASYPASPRPVRVLLANIRIAHPVDGSNAWPNRRELLVKTFHHYTPDILALQEVSPTQGAYICKEMPGYAHYPDGRDETDAGLLAPLTTMVSSLNLVLYKADRFEVRASSHGRIRADAPTDDPRTTAHYVFVLLHDQTGALPDLLLVNTHLRHDPAVALRDAQLLNHRLVEAKRRWPDARVVLLGDMNSARGTPVYAALVGDPAAYPGVSPLALRDTYDYAAKPRDQRWGSWHAFTGKPRAMWPSDLVLVSGEWHSTPAQILRDHDRGRYPSDHFPVLVVLR